MARVAVDPGRKDVYALVHNEYQGHLYNSGCPSSSACWFNSITSAVSTNSGATFTQAAGADARWLRRSRTSSRWTGPNGYFMPSNIVRSGDGYFYAMFRAQPKGAQQLGTCLMRTRDLSDPTSWRAWNGTTFSVQFHNPYLQPVTPATTTSARRSTS